jgi:amino acid adenylation domain-containing protein
VSPALSGSALKQLEAVASLEKVSLRAVSLAALETLVYRYTGQEEFAITCIFAGGRDGETESDAEGVLSVLTVQADLNGRLSFIELARRLERQLAESHARKDMSFDLPAQAPQAGHGLNDAWSWQVVMAFEDECATEARLLKRLSRQAMNGAALAPDLILHLCQEAHGLRIEAEYNADLFDAATISRLLGHFETLLAGVATRPEITLAEVPLVTGAEHRQLVHALNETRTDFPQDACLHHLFEMQAESQPHAAAVLFAERSLSYAELNRRANQLAHYLRGLGVGIGTTVGLCVGRSVEMVVGILGILKAGAAYVPLDPGYPQERLSFMLRDTKTSVLVGESGLIERLPLEYVSHAVRVDTDSHLIARQKAENPSSGVGAEDLAYVIYTSGSTGVPKGIAIRHRGVVNNITDLNRRFGVGPGDLVLSLSSLSFDMCVYEVLGTLAAGAGIVLPAREQERDPTHWAALIEKHGVTLWNSAPSLLEMLVEQVRGLSGRRPLSSIRLAFLGGDWVAVTLPERLREAAGREVEVVVMGGATELSIHSTIYCVGERDPTWRSIPYGRPMANQQVYVLDERQQLVPVGVPGELHLGGVGLAWGYFNRPDLTAEKFVPHPFSQTPGERLYKTGDLVRYMPDGELELLGRMDFQVKLRGLRIELGEITAALKEHPLVEDAVVIAREDEPGDKRLAAYLVAGPHDHAADSRSLAKSLRSALSEKLPDYMIPAAFVLLDALPLTPNGKVDRRALPRPQPIHLSSTEPTARPHTPAQELIAGIWSGVLGVASDALGVNDDFFELGGHSLLATRAASRIRNAFGVEMTPRAIFQNPTIASQAEFVERAVGGGRHVPTPPLPARPRAATEPLSFAQQRLWFFDQMQPGNPFYNIPVSIHLAGVLDIEALERSFGEIVRRHEALRTTFISAEGQPAQVIGKPRPVRVPVVELSGMAADERERAVRALSEEEAQASFDLAEGPLLRVKLLRLAADEYVMLLTMHHIVSDGWSAGVLVRELTALYSTFSREEEVSLPEPPIQYADFARWQREWLSGEVLDAQLSYWIQKLAGATTVLELPADHPRPPVQSYRGARVEFRLPAKSTRRLKLLSRQSGATLFMTLLAAFDVLLSRHTGREDVLVGVPLANRNRAEIEPLIGFFVNTLVLRADLSGEPTFLELLGRVRESALEAYANQDLPFERLVEELQPERDPSRNPLFQAMFIFENVPQEELHLPGLNLGTVDFNNAVGARTDVDLYLWEASGELNGRFIYNADIFEAETIRRLCERFRFLAESIAQNPAATISNLRMGRETELPPITAGHGGAREAPLSYHQERLWFIEQFEAGNVYETSPTYHNLPLILRLSGPVEAGVIEDSLNALVERHAALRTGIITAGDRAFQAVSPRETLKLKVLDLSTRGERPADDRALEVALAEARQPLDLERSLPLRAALLRMGGERAMLVVTLHHALADQRSLRIIGEELAEIYTARRSGRVPRLTEVNLTYADYVAWQRNLPTEALDDLLLYWKWQLRGGLQALELPEDRPRPAIHTYTPTSCPFSLGEELTERINALARGAGADAFTVVLAAFKALLRGYTRQDEIVVGTSVACRNQPGTENLVGPLSNLLVLRTDVRSSLPFISLLRRVGDTVGRALAHQEMPFDRLVQELKPEKDMSRTALFDVLFRFEEDELPELGFGHARAQMVDTNLGHGKYDLSLSVRAGRGGFEGTLVYNADIYDGETIDRMVRHFRVMLEAVTSAPERKLGDITLLSEAEEYRQLVAWNSTATAYPADKTVHELFEEQARRTPGNIAVVCGDTRFTYVELDERANRLAHYLRARGVRPDTLVALCLDRSPEMIVALLAVLKAGGAYLPLEPSHPEERLRFILADSGVSHLITTSSLMSRVPGAVTDTILLDAERETLNALPDFAPAGGATPNSLAYVIYTSGSTGKPKGVLIEHGNVVRLMMNDRLPFAFTGADIWTMFHSYCFDFSVWEMYGALLYGGTLVVVPEQVTKDPSLFLGLLAREKVTVLNQTPTAFYNLTVEALGGPPDGLALRYVIFGGETLHPVRLREWKQAYPAVKLVNMYGITETTVHVTFKEVTDREVEENVSNIGRPIPTTTTYVMGSDLRLLPVGVPGEVCVGGLGVSRGYLGRDELTRRRFVPNPYRPDELIYRSGDLAKLRRDGELIYLGRIDDQVQIRGFRVEPGEVKSRLLEHPSVSEAEVLATKGRQETPELVAYVVPKAEASVASLRAHLSETLPYYMVPAVFVMLKALPVTPNGKVDRRALPAPDWSKLSAAAAPLRPRTPVEELLAGIWAEVLGVEPDRLCAGDNFFELGGHSLLATQVTSRIRKVFALALPVSVMFQTRSLAELAEGIESGVRAGRTAHGLTIRPVPRDETLPLSFGQQRLWFLDQLQPGNPFYNIPVALSMSGRLNVETLAESLDEVVGRHESLRTTFATREGMPVQLIAARATVPLNVVELGHLPGAAREAETRQLIREEALTAFDLGVGPLLRAKLLRLDDDEHILLLTMHHIVGDGWSASILVRELTAIYSAHLEGKTSPLTTPVIQYADFAQWQREWLSGEVLDAQLTYWKRQLAGVPAVPELPTDRPRPSIQSFRGARIYFELEAQTVRRLKKQGQANGATLYMLLLAAFDVVLSRYTGQEDILVGSPIANRSHSEVEDVIGFFVNTLVLRVDLSGEPSFSELVRRVREVALGAYANQDVPFERLVEELSPKRDLSRNPIFDVMFALHTPPRGVVSLPGVSLSLIPFDEGTTQFDVSVVLDETGESLRGNITYSTDLFDEATMRRLAGHYVRVLEQVAEDPSRRVSDLELMSPPERRQLLDEWNQTWAAYPSGMCAHELFEEQARRTPEAAAVACEGRALTYAELDACANRLAHYLRGLGVKPEVRVAVLLERSVESAVALLGIMKAGGVYVPLSPDYPAERVEWVVTDSGAQVVLTQETLRAKLFGTRARVVCVDTDARAIEGHGGFAPEPLAAPANVSYMIYTSGSTGRPKGVMVEHASLVNTLTYGRHAFALKREDVAGVIASFSFDISLLELMTSWSAGACSLILSREEILNMELLARRLAQTTVFLAVPSFMRHIIDSLRSRETGCDFGALTRVLTGGELIPPHILKDIEETFPASVTNVLYGPTETTLICAEQEIPRGSDVRKPLVGRPIANTRIYILDGRMRPVPAGVRGELYIGGAGLARGYMNSPGLTAERFVPDPFGAKPGARLYRTGDVGRYQSDGSIEFAGRTDQQVKIRGYRIEPSEIDSVLAEHPAVSAAVTVTRQDGDGELYLVSYVVLDSPDDGTGELWEWLRVKLPAYMLPKALQRINKIPTTGNGKVDRDALPEASPESAGANASYVPARSPVEQKIAALWADVLQVGRVGVRDNFFDLGGHSLLLARLRDAIHTELGSKLSMVDMFTFPTVEAMTQRLSEVEVESREAPGADASERLAAGRRRVSQLRKRHMDAEETPGF